MKSVFGLMVALVLAGSLTLMVSAQPPPPPPAGPVIVQPAVPPMAWSYSAGSGNAWYQHFHTQSEAAELARKLAKAENEDEKAQLRTKLTAMLDQVFDEHMKQQQKELDDLETQIRNLRALMKKRANAKQTIVERRIEQLIQDADGLGWNAPNAPGLHLQYSTQPLHSIAKPTAKATTPKKKTERSKDKDRKDSDDEDNDNDE
jgi:hypothetical protein